jgi:hypothetical protein
VLRAIPTDFENVLGLVKKIEKKHCKISDPTASVSCSHAHLARHPTLCARYLCLGVAARNPSPGRLPPSCPGPRAYFLPADQRPVTPRAVAVIAPHPTCATPRCRHRKRTRRACTAPRQLERMKKCWACAV